MTIKEKIETFDTLIKKGFDEHEVCSALKELIPKDNSDIHENLMAELIAFDLIEEYPDNKTGWGTYFGPLMVLNNNDGTVTESPSIKLVNAKMIEYWENRAKETINPILKARYSGVVWDFKNKITGLNPSHEICRLYVNALVEIANGDFHKYVVDTFKKLKRALFLAISLNDNNLIIKVKDSILRYENEHSKDDKPGLWGYAFDLLISNKKIALTIEEENGIINELEAKLNRLTNSDSENQKTDPWAAENAASRLALYYRKSQRNDDIKRVLLKVGKAYSAILDKASPLQAISWLDQLHKLYIKFNLHEEAEIVLLKIRELGPKTSSEFKTISHSFKIQNKNLDDYIKAMTSGTLSEILFRIAARYIPIKEKVKEQIFDLSKTAPLTFLVTRVIQDEKGRVVATIGSLEDDLEGHVVIQISQNLYFSSIFLRAVLKECITNKGLNKSNILSFIEKSPIIEKERLEIIDRGLDAYVRDDFLVFVHLVIPQIEEAIRNIIELAGGNILKPAKGGGYQLRNFDEILRDEIIKLTLGEDIADYFRILFTDQRGWNLRNIVCHGLANPNMFNTQNADRILHSLICLGLIQEKK
jgi:hypothetical protein